MQAEKAGSRLVSVVCPFRSHIVTNHTVPTSALDVTTQAQIIRQFMELRDEFGASIIVVTHNLGVAAYMSDYMVVMKQGIIEDRGSREHILYRTQNEYTKKLLDAVPSLGGVRYV